VRLWPARQRLHSQRTLRPARSLRTKSADRNDVVVGCVNAQFLGNKAPKLCRSIIDEQLDILIVTETGQCWSSILYSGCPFPQKLPLPMGDLDPI